MSPLGLGAVGSGTGSGGGSGNGYGEWVEIASVTGVISTAAVTVALNTDEVIDTYEELYIHIEANDAQRPTVSVCPLPSF